MNHASRLSGIAALLLAPLAFATNPLILDQFTADPTARVFDGKVYVYASHDIHEPPGYTGRKNWFVMEDYHVFSSTNLTDWTDHGVILTQKDVPWADGNAYSMWAPDCVFANGKYYFFFPAKDKAGEKRIGVAIGDTPVGPFKPQPDYIEGVVGIDPDVFIDADGSAYLSWSRNDALVIARLKPDLLALDGEVKALDNLPKKGLQEGPFMVKRDGTYYLTYPHVANRIERLEYATSKSPMGPFEWKGVLLDESASGCWTSHHSIVDYRGQWYLFYHDRDLSPANDKRRSIRADKLFFESDGSIRKVTPTLRGVGLVDATREIQIDRYSARSGEAVKVSYLDEANPHAGWQTTFDAAPSWIRFDAVDFARGRQKTVEIRARGTGSLEIRLDGPDGPVLARVKTGGTEHWTKAKARARGVPSGVHDLFVTQTSGAPLSVDWIRFQ
jgi:hypothetical protein